jgi:hypothetical protein
MMTNEGQNLLHHMTKKGLKKVLRVLAVLVKVCSLLMNEKRRFIFCFLCFVFFTHTPSHHLKHNPI